MFLHSHISIPIALQATLSTPSPPRRPAFAAAMFGNIFGGAAPAKPNPQLQRGVSRPPGPPAATPPPSQAPSNLRPMGNSALAAGAGGYGSGGSAAPSRPPEAESTGGFFNLPVASGAPAGGGGGDASLFGSLSLKPAAAPAASAPLFDAAPSGSMFGCVGGGYCRGVRGVRRECRSLAWL